MTAAKSILVAACGNSLAGDDAFGLMVLLRLQPLGSRDHAEGELLDLDCADVNRLSLEIKAAGSPHDFGLSWQLRLAAALKLMPPHARLVGLVIRPSRVGDPMSASLSSEIPRAAE